MKNILVPTDFSEFAKYAMDFSSQLARQEQAKVTLLHSVHTSHLLDSLYLDPILAGRLMKDMEEGAKEHLKKFSGQMVEKDVDVACITTTGPLIDAIEEVIKEVKADLVVMGTQGASGLKEFFVGSNTERVMRLSSVPVMAVPAPRTLADVKYIVVPIDYANVTHLFTEQLLAYKQIFGAKLCFVWVRTHHFMEDERTLHLNFEEFAKEKFGSDFDLIMKRDVVPEDAILRVVAETKADMVIMPTHQRRGLEHLFLGSTTENLTNHSPVPVIGVPVKKEHERLDLAETHPSSTSQMI